MWSELSPLKVSVDFAELEANFAAREAPKVRPKGQDSRAKRSDKDQCTVLKTRSIGPLCLQLATVRISQCRQEVVSLEFSRKVASRPRPQPQCQIEPQLSADCSPD